MIDVKNISKRFGDNQIMDDYNLHVENGEKIAIIGPSGCGKSTMFRMLLGLITPDTGQLYFNGQNIPDMTYLQLQEMRKKVGVLFQSAALFDSMTVGENVGFSLVENFHMPPNAVQARVEEILDMVEMSGYENAMPSDLSGGQKKRIGLARAIAGKPELLIYDEPTTGLDPVLSTSIEDVISRLNTQLNVTSIVVSHQKSTILRTADRIYMMNEGRLLDPESPDTIENASNPVIRRFIRGELHEPS
ncbi:ATP-binding cassette domain-containing protein [bacterium]|jgi:phospholipid/cholesterol/gamma-HCH transport system ATP-binding protein|nr:ATP-binding cassette domain-containing protein [bacterium]